MNRIIRGVCPQFRIKRGNSFVPLEEGTVLYITHDNRQVLPNNPWPTEDSQRWCWEYLIGRDGRPVGTGNFPYGGGYILSGSVYNFFVLRDGSPSATPLERALFFTNSTDVDFTTINRGDNPRGTRLHQNQWQYIHSRYESRRITENVLGQIVDLVPVPEKRLFFGVRLNLQEFNVYSSGYARQQSLKIAAKNWSDSIEAKDLHELTDNEYNETYSTDTYHSKAIKTEGAFTDAVFRYTCDILNDHFIKSQVTLTSSDDASYHDSIVNNLQTKGLGVHIGRDGTYNDTENSLHNFDPQYIRSQLGSENIKLTEKLGMKIFLFLKGKINSGDVKYWEFKHDGKIEEVAESTYNGKARMMEADSVKPGLQQIHVLLEQDGASANIFRLSEVYCDGDVLYGPSAEASAAGS